MASSIPPHKARKRFGQNFLHDPFVIDRILEVTAPKAHQHLIEIGPGQGALTQGLINSGAQCDIIELDRDLTPRLMARFLPNPNVRIYQADALGFDFTALAQTDNTLRIVGNLPYNISTPLLFHLLSQHPVIHDMHFMLQKEVGLRLSAAAGSKAYGRLSLMVQSVCHVEHLLDIAPESFDPAPKVDSVFIRLTPYTQNPHPLTDPALFAALIQQAFSMRRKTLRNNLKTLVSDTQFSQCDIDARMRPEQITLHQFVRLANALSASS